MKNYLKKLIIVALPLTIIAFCLVTAKADEFCDGGRFTAYGFPFFWTTPGATSLAPATDMALFALDLGTYLIIFAALSATRLLEPLVKGKALIAGAGLWITAIIVSISFTFAVFYFGHQDGIFTVDCRQKNYRPHIGFPIGGAR